MRVDVIRCLQNPALGFQVSCPAFEEDAVE